MFSLVAVVCTTSTAWSVEESQGAAKTIITEISLPKEVSAPQAIMVDAVGDIWFTEKVGKSLNRFAPQSQTFSVHPLPEDWGRVGPFRIVAGVESDIWFVVRRWADAESATNFLGQFRVDEKQFKKHPLPEGMLPEDLAVDGDGVVWFLNPEQNRIQRYQPQDGQLQGYAIPTEDGYPRGIVLDEKGGLWFSEANSNRIGRFDRQTATFQEFDIPTPFANPGSIAVDRKGRIWFVELTANRIGVFYPDMERFDEAIIPTANGLPNAIVADDQGYVWFLEYRGNKVGRFDPLEARFREFDIPTFGSLPGELVIDRQRGRIWFSESGTEAKKLGMISIREALAAKEPPVTALAGSDRVTAKVVKDTDETILLWMIGSVVAVMLLFWLVYSVTRKKLQP